MLLVTMVLATPVLVGELIQAALPKISVIACRGD